MTTREARLLRWRTSFYAVWAIIGVLMVLYGVMMVLGRIAPALAPFILGLLIVLMVQRPVAQLESQGMSRGIATAACFTLGLLILTAFGVFIVPVIGKQFVGFAAAMPGFVEQGQELLNQTQREFSRVVLPDWLRDAALDVGRSFSNVFVSVGNMAAAGLFTAGGGIATAVFDLFIGLVIAFWISKDLPTIRSEIRTLAGEKYEDDFENLAATVGRMVGGYVKGQTIASVVTGALAALGLWAIGVKFPVVLGIVTFVFNYVPYVGPFVAGLLAAILGLFQAPLTGLLAIVVVLVSQNLTDAIVTPRVMSKQVDLHPTLVIFSLLVGGTLFGFWGMIFAIPVAATAKALFVYYYERKTNTQLATEDGALFKVPVCDESGVEPCTPAEETDPGEPKPPHVRGEEPAEGAPE